MSHRHCFFIDGHWVEPARKHTIDVINPANGAVFDTIAAGDAEDIERAIAAARRAQPGFAQTPLAERRRLMARVVDGLERHRNALATTLSQEMGAPTPVARGAQVDLGIAHFKHTLEALADFDFERCPSSTTILREPIGVVGLITPWNWPINQIACKVAPALATGCTMVLKPSEIAPFNAVLFAEILQEAGVPPGVFNLVQGHGADVGAALATHPDIDMISVTGSTRAGVAVANAAAPTVKRVHQELGGKSPYLVLPDADLEPAVTAAVARCFENSGQSCNAPSRLLVPHVHRDQAVDLARAAAATFCVGAPDQTDTDLGPVVSAAQYDHIQALIASGVSEGATLVAGGTGRPQSMTHGYYVRPTVFADVDPAMTIAREEIFGPVLALMTYDHVEQAIEIANDTPYGLAAYIFGAPQAAQATARRINAGSIHINEPAWDGAAPFGGYKQSGNGREYGAYGLAEFTETKAIVGDRPTVQSMGI